MNDRLEVWPGQPAPRGASYDGVGVNFALFSEVAERVELCLFDDRGREQTIALPDVSAFVHHGYIPGLRPGQRYGFRVFGPWDPARGLRCNPTKVLIDPYAKAVEGGVEWNDAVYGYRLGGSPDARSRANSARYVPKSVVTSPWFDWGNDRLPRTPWHQTVIYEAHVKGLTIRHPDVPPSLRGSYSALGRPEVIDHLKALGITALELMPVHQFIHDEFLVRKGLRNYWGYNSVAYLAPHDQYAAQGKRGEQVQEFKQMVKSLHQAGIEVILDVVYNHTAEGNHLGPTLSMRGIDNAAYYRLSAEDQRYYVDYTGTGNSLNMRHPHVLQLIMDSLRYWVLEMHVDGFRFDLASTLARELHDVDRLSSFFDLIQQDPIVSQVKLIAEPWDVGEGGYQVGNFPPLWSEWNGKYRDCVRDLWRGQPATLAEFASRFSGSSDLYESNGRRPFHSVNFVTAHDGFTLNDLVSYDRKHNEANGEDGRDGSDDNRSWNCGVEGPTDDPTVMALRCRQRRNFLATLLLSQGVPMILHGDELGRSQAGNNNAYCQDGEMSWLDWASADHDLLAFTRGLVALRERHPVFRRRRWFQGRPLHGAGVDDIGWFTPGGEEMSEEDWSNGYARSVAVFLTGSAIPDLDPRGRSVMDQCFLVLVNAHHEPIDFVMPGGRWARPWWVVLDTAGGSPPQLAPDDRTVQVEEGGSRHIEGRSIVLLQERE